MFWQILAALLTAPLAFVALVRASIGTCGPWRPSKRAAMHRDEAAYRVYFAALHEGVI